MVLGGRGEGKIRPSVNDRADRKNAVHSKLIFMWSVSCFVFYLIFFFLCLFHLFEQARYFSTTNDIALTVVPLSCLFITYLHRLTMCAQTLSLNYVKNKYFTANAITQSVCMCVSFNRLCTIINSVNAIYALNVFAYESMDWSWIS